MLTACGGSAVESPNIEPTTSGATFEYFQDQSFVAVLPGWEQTPADAQETLHMVQQDGQFVLINRYRELPQTIVEQFKISISEDPAAYLVLEEERDGKPYFEYTTREDNQTMRVQVVLEYCQGQTYALAAGGRDTTDNADLLQHVLLSGSCQDPVSVPVLPVGKIGMMVNPAGDDYLEGYYPALRLAKENGVQVVHTYLRWGDIEPSAGERIWEWQDFLLGFPIKEGFEISLVVNLIHTNVQGPIPDDLVDVDFDDPVFISRFSAFILEVLDRYPVNYLSLGNEVNDYFVNHRDQIPAYQTFFEEVKDTIHQHYPEIKVAMTFAYHDAETNNSLDIIDTLNRGDFLPLTLYLYSPGFKFDRSPAELPSYLDRILEVADGVPIAFAEIGWNTAVRLEGEQQDQAEFIRQAFQMLSLHQEQIEYLGWFNLHDSLRENASQAALTFIPPNAPLAQDEAYMRDFVDFLSTMGLRENDGNPKAGWYTFQEESKNYLENFQE